MCVCRLRKGSVSRDPAHLDTTCSRAGRIFVGLEFGALVVHGVSSAADSRLTGGLALPHKHITVIQGPMQGLQDITEVFTLRDHRCVVLMIIVVVWCGNYSFPFGTISRLPNNNMKLSGNIDKHSTERFAITHPC